MLILITSTGRVEQRSLEVPDLDEAAIADLRTRLNAAAVGQNTTGAVAQLSLLLSEVPDAEQVAFRVCAASLLEMLGADADSRIVVAGVQNLTRFADDFQTTVRPVLEALEEQVVLLKLLGETAESDVVTVRIGQENPYKELQSTSIVSTGYGSLEDTWATLGIVGPTRMDYPSTMASVRAVARYVGRFLSEG